MRVTSAGLTTAAVALLAGSLVAMPATATASPRHSRPGCPAAESLVPKTTWHRHAIAPGIALAEGDTTDARGKVDLRVLRINLAHRHVHLGPLMKTIASRSPLSTLAAGHQHLVAAVNTGYFDFITGAPVGPLIVGGKALVLSTRHQEVVGVNSAGHAQSGTVWGSLSASYKSTRHSVNGINELRAPAGLSIYTPRWGSKAVRLGSGTSRDVSAAGRTSSLGHSRHVPSSGYLLIAKGASAEQWLAAIGSGHTLTLRGAIHTTAAKPFVQAYGVGNEIVKQAGHAITGFSCDSANTKTPARTAIGFADGGKQLIIAIAADHPGTSLHGLDKDQMSKLMVQLGAAHAYVFDGSGSSELLARMPGTHSLSLRTYPADGVQRPMPLGLGIYYS